MRTYRCAGCGEPLAAFVAWVPPGLPFSPIAATAAAAAARRGHAAGCTAGPTEEGRRRAAG